ncbi:splicing factor-like protein 1 [Papaver somniferum]|nr:splicing factor-like protein 1 [Papaver somniferum]XP_026380116.1 splicing factor-like protein 1 [Papaver somniferum]
MRRTRRINSSINASKHKTHAEKLVEEITGKASKESVVQLTSDSDCRNCKVKKEKPTKAKVEESVRINSDEKKRTLDAALGKLGSVEVHPSLKKCNSEQYLKPKVVVGPAVTPLTDGSRTPGSFCSNESTSEKQERSGSSGKRGRSRWDSQSEGEGEGNEGDRGGKRRKTKWTDNGSLLKKLGPLKLPDFVKVPVSIADPQRHELNERLSVINSKLQRKDLHDDWPEEEWSPFPPPLDDNLEFGMNSKDVKLREKLIQERQAIISRLIQKNPTFRSPPPEPKPSVFFKKLYLPVREYPGYNFFGLIIGPRGNTQKRMEKETGAKITIKGKASGNDGEKMVVRSGNEDLHVLVQADNQKSVDEAVSKVEKLLIPIDEGLNDHKHAQLQELSKICRVCGEEGHKSYDCPCRSSSFNSSCSRCGRSHVSFTCPFMAPSLSNSGGKNSSGSSPSYWSYSQSSIKSTPPTVESKIRIEVDDRNLFVGHLPLTVDKNRLMELFSPFGTLVEAKVIKDRNAGFHKDYGFVRYDSAVNAAAAVAAMNGYLIDGKTLAVKLAGNVHVPGLSPRISVLSKYPATIFKDSPSQTTCPCPPGPMLSSPRTPIYKCDALGLPPISIFPGHYDSSSGKKLPSSQGSSSYRFPSSSPSSVVWFPGSRSRISHGYRSNFFSTPTSSQSPQLYLTPPVASRLTPLSY